MYLNNEAPTVVKRKLESGSDLILYQNEGEFNLYSKLQVIDDILEVKTEEYYQQTAGGGIAIIQGTTSGWTRKRNWTLGIPVQLGSAESGPGGYFPSTSQLDFQADWTQPEFCMLMPLLRLTVRLGNNLQIIQREQMNWAPHLTMTTLDNEYNWTERIAMADIGLPYSVAYCTGRNAVLANLNQANTYQANAYRGNISFEHFNMYNYYRMIIQAGSSPGFFTQEIGLPLGFVNAFFQEESYLPPGLYFKIEIEFQTQLMILAYNTVNVPSGPQTPASATSCVANIKWGTNPGTFNLRFRSVILKHDLCDQINKEWLKRPLLYQYNSFDPFEVAGDGTTTTFAANVAISQQRPSMFYMRPMLSATQKNIVQHGAPFFQSFFPNSTIPATFGDVFVFINGRQAYYFRDGRNGATQGYPAPRGGTAIFNEKINTHVNRTNPTMDPIQASHSINYYNGALFSFSVDPGDLQRRGFITADQGSVTIRIVFTVTDIVGLPFSNLYRIVIYKKFPEQVQIDCQKNLTTIEWPGKVTTNGYLLPSQYNMN